MSRGDEEVCFSLLDLNMQTPQWLLDNEAGEHRSLKGRDFSSHTIRQNWDGKTTSSLRSLHIASPPLIAAFLFISELDSYFHT